MEISLSRLIGFCVSLALSGERLNAMPSDHDRHAYGLCNVVLFTGMFVYALYTLRNRKKVSDVSSVVTAALVVMFLLNTAQLCEWLHVVRLGMCSGKLAQTRLVGLQAADVYLAFFEWKGAGGPSGYFLDYGSKILPARESVLSKRRLTSPVTKLNRTVTALSSGSRAL